MSCRTSPEHPRRRQSLCGGGGFSKKAVDGLSLVKTEHDADIKDYAETAMNELLGWYGYDKVNASEARSLNLRTPSSSSSSPQRTDGASPKSRAGDVSDDISEKEGSSRDAGGTGTPVLDGDSFSTNGNITCAWCLKNGLKLFTLKTAAGQTKAFCSELCFDQCRRAAFKKNRVCDWCKHVRHTVSYVDFQDKERQLQFCSDKCLNQYKMNIFCRETQAYLQMHPHLQEAASKNAGGCSNLITPDLWLRDCKETANGERASSDDEEGAAFSDHHTSTYPTDSTVAGDSLQPLSTVGTFKESPKPEAPIPAGELSNMTSMKPSDQHTLDRTAAKLLKIDSGRHSENSRRRSNLLDRDNTSRTDRSSVRVKPTFPDSFGKVSQPRSIRSPNKHFFTEHRGLYGRMSPPSPSYPPPPLINGPSAPKHVGSSSATSSSVTSATGSSTLPPPPPLLSSEMLPPPMLHHQGYHHQPLSLLEQQQHLEAFLAMQNSLGLRMGMLPNQRPAFPDHAVHSSPLNLSTTRGLPSSNPLLPSATVMLPYPLVIPLPVPIPIPIPIPLPEFLRSTKQAAEKTKGTVPRSNMAEEQAKRVDNIITRLMTKHQGENCELDATLRRNKSEDATLGSAGSCKTGGEDSEHSVSLLMDSSTEQSSRTRHKRASSCSGASYKERTKRMRNADSKF